MSDLQGGSLYESILRAAAAGRPALPPARLSAAVVPWRRAAALPAAEASPGATTGPAAGDGARAGGASRLDGGGDATLPAAGGVLGSGAGGGVEVFWVQRAASLSFMGGWHAFPGGGLSRTDAEVAVAAAPEGGPAGPAPGILACAIRELFEEVGILLARPEAGAAFPTAAELAAARRALLGGEGFSALLRRLGLQADASRLVPAGRWLTPPFSPLRFDNQFFLLEWPREERAQPEVIPGELASGAWIEAGQAWESWRRGEVLAAPPILHFLEVLRQEGPAAGLARLVDPREADLGPVRRVELRPGVVMFPLATQTLPPAATTNAYLLGHRQCVLVDPGASSAHELEQLEQALAAARERLGRRVVAIWVTHHHADHIGGVARLRASLGAPVLAHPFTADRLAAQGIAVDGTLHDGQRIVLAGEPPLIVRAIHTPGHARGHLCFLAEDTQSLLAGDMVAGFGTIVIDPPEGDMDDYLASLERLLALAPRTLFPGHGPAILDAAGKLREYIEHRLWREGRVLEAWNAGRRTPAEMLPVVYDDVPREAHPLAERQLLAHLARLRRQGKVS